MAKRVIPKPAPKQSGALTVKLMGEFILAKRTQEGMSQNDAALLCGVSKRTLCKIESGSDGVQLGSVLKVAQMLGIEIIVKPWEDQGVNGG